MQKGSETDMWHGSHERNCTLRCTLRRTQEHRGSLEDCLALRSERHLRFSWLTLSLSLSLSRRPALH